MNYKKNAFFHSAYPFMNFSFALKAIFENDHK